MNDEDLSEARTVKSWSVGLELFEEGGITEAHAVLRDGGVPLEARGSAQRSSDDAPVPEIGDDFAAGRALVALGHQLLRIGEHQAAQSDVAQS